jgi:hypothetical protein
MPDRTIDGPVDLVCDDCPREFTGRATYKVHTIEETGEERVMLGQVLSTCPIDPSHTIRLRNS